MAETWTVGSGKDYATLQLAEDAKNGDMTGRGVVSLECYSSAAPDGKCTVAGGTNQDASNHITITAPDAEYHAGSFQGGYYITESADGGIYVNDPFVTVEKMDIDITHTSTSFYYPIFSNAANTTVDRCMLKVGSGSNLSGVNMQGANTKIHRTVVHSDPSSERGMSFNGTGTEVFEVFQCSLYSTGAIGIRIANGDVDVRNTAVIGYTTDFSAGAGGGWDANADNCATSEATTPFGSSNQHSAVATTEWTDPANSDFTIKSGAAKLPGNGQDLSGTFTTDIVGNTFAADDIGAFAETSAVTGTAGFQGAGGSLEASGTVVDNTVTGTAGFTGVGGSLSASGSVSSIGTYDDSIADNRVAKLRDSLSVTTGNVNDLWAAWLDANTTGTAESLQGLEELFLDEEGVDAGNLNTRWYKWLGAAPRSLTGSLQDRWAKYWKT